MLWHCAEAAMLFLMVAYGFSIGDWAQQFMHSVPSKSAVNELNEYFPGPKCADSN